VKRLFAHPTLREFARHLDAARVDVAALRPAEEVQRMRKSRNRYV
jgi:hypothetical protein